MVSFGEKLKDAVERSRIVRLWGRRIDATGMSRAEFCRKYEIDGGQLSKWVTGTHGPGWESIERVERALKAEGV